VDVVVEFHIEVFCEKKKRKEKKKTMIAVAILFLGSICCFTSAQNGGDLNIIITCEQKSY